MPSDIPLRAPGIYIITCSDSYSDWSYVGSSVDVYKRRLEHLNDFRSNRHGNPRMQNAYNKYGEDAFVFTIVEYVDDVQSLLIREQHWIDLLEPEFNIMPRAGNHLGFRYSEESRRKMSESHKGQIPPPSTRAAVIAAHIGKPRSLETRAKISASNTGKKKSLEERAQMSKDRKGKPVPYSTVANMIASNKGRPCSPEKKAKIAAANIGKKMSPEAKAKMSAAKKGKKQSPELIAKRMESMKRNGKIGNNQYNH